MLHFKLLTHQPFSGEVQPWLAWAISCYWNLLFKQSLQKLYSQNKSFTIQSTLPHSFYGSRPFTYIHREKTDSCSSLPGKNMKSLCSELQVRRLWVWRGTSKGLNRPSQKSFCRKRVSHTTATEHIPEALGAKARTQSYLFCWVFFSLGQFNETEILKFADKSKKIRKFVSLSHTCNGPLPSREAELPEHNVAGQCRKKSSQLLTSC